MVLKIYQEQLM